MELNKRIETEVELSGWWNGRAKVDSPVDENKYKAFFDTEYLAESDKHMIVNISNDKDLGDYIVPADMLNEFCREQILEHVMDGNMFGSVFEDGESLEWSWEPKVTIEGISVDLQDDLSDVSKDHITKAMLEDQCLQGEVCELDTVNINVAINEDTFDGKAGVVFIDTEFSRLSVLNDTEQVSFSYKDGDIQFEHTPVGNLPERTADEIRDFIKNACDEKIARKEK